MSLKGREISDKFWREKLTKHQVKFLDEKLVYGWFLDKSTKTWISLFDTVWEYNFDIALSFNEIVVPTQDSIRMKYVVILLLTS